MQIEREEQPVSSKPGSRPVESEGEPVSLRDIEMILAPGIAPPPLPTLAKAPSKLPTPRKAAEAPAAEAPKAPPRWTAEATPLRRRKERSLAPSAPDAAFQGLRLTPTPQEPKASDDGAKATATSSSAPPPAPAGGGAEHHRALPTPQAKAPVIVEASDGIDVALDGEESAPPSGLLDVRTMMAVLDEEHHKSSHFDDEVLNLTGGVMGLGAPSPLLSPLPPPIDEGPRADEEEVLSLPTPGTSPKKLLAPVIPLGEDPEEAVEVSFPLGDPETLARAKTSDPKGPVAKKPAQKKAKPAAATGAEGTAAPSAERSKLPWIIAAGAVAVAAWMVLRPAPTAPPLPTPPPPTAATEQVPTPPAAVTAAAPTAVTGAPSVAAPEAPATPSSAKEAETTAATKPEAAKPEAAKPEAAKPEAAKPEAAKPEAAKPEAAKPEPAAPAPAASGPEFDKAAANAALSSAAGAASGCRAPDDPQGTARVSVKFAPSGRVTSALVSGPPFAGTPTGSCIAKAFRGISVPPFSGDPVTVSKSFSIR